MAVDLLDIAAPEEPGETIEVLGQPIEIRGIRVAEMAKIMRRFPDMRRALFSEGAPEDVRGVSLLEAWPAIVAAGLGHVGDAQYEAAAERLPRGEMMKLGSAILALTNPRQEPPGPLAADAPDAPAAPTSSPPPSST